MSYQARYIGLDEVLEAFQKKAKTPYFSLWLKGQPLAQYRDGDTMEDSIEKIKEEIELGVKRQITHEHELYLHNKKEKDYTRKSESYAVIGFRCFELPGAAVAGADPHQAYNMYAMNSELNRLKSELSALQAAKQQEEEDDDEDQEPNSLMSGVNQILEHPLIVGMLNKWLQQPVKNLAGVNPDQNLQDTINILFSKGVQLEHLQKLAAMPADKIQMLLTML
jgi:hypothetical protein